MAGGGTGTFPWAGVAQGPSHAPVGDTAPPVSSPGGGTGTFPWLQVTQGHRHLHQPRGSQGVLQFN